MRNLLLGSFVALHGLVHLWYVTLALRLVEYRADMGWTGESWLFTGVLGDATTRALATAVYLLAVVAFLGAGIGLGLGSEWARLGVVISAVYSTVVIVMFWGGGLSMLVQKGLLALVINAVILAAVVLGARH